jgi:hypothetical protein
LRNTQHSVLIMRQHYRPKETRASIGPHRHDRQLVSAITSTLCSGVCSGRVSRFEPTGRVPPYSQRLSTAYPLTPACAASNRVFDHRHHAGVLSEILGTKRVTIAAAAGELQRAKLIEYRRGHIHILNHDGLEEVVCDCYATVKVIHEGLYL